MAQPVGSVGCVVKNNVGYVNFAGAQVLGDGVTVVQVTPKTAAELSDASGLVTLTDVVISSGDFALSVQSLNNSQRS